MSETSTARLTLELPILDVIVTLLRSNEDRLANIEARLAGIQTEITELRGSHNASNIRGSQEPQTSNVPQDLQMSSVSKAPLGQANAMRVSLPSFATSSASQAHVVKAAGDKRFSLPDYASSSAAIAPSDPEKAREGNIFAGFSVRNHASQVMARQTRPAISPLMSEDVALTDSEDEIPPRAPVQGNLTTQRKRKDFSGSTLFESPMDPPSRPAWGVRSLSPERPAKKQKPRASLPDGKKAEDESENETRPIITLPVSSQQQGGPETFTRSGRASKRPANENNTDWSTVDYRVLYQRLKKK